MRTYTRYFLICGALLAACGTPAEEGGGGPAVEPGKGGSTGGKKTGGSTGSASGGSGGGSSASGGAGGGSTATGGSGSGSTATGGSGSTATGGSGSTSTGGTSGSTDGGGSPTPSDTAPEAPSATPPSAGGFSVCPNCKPLFDGKNLDNWVQASAGAWVIKEGAMASTGRAADIWTKEDYGAYRIFFSVRQIRGNHQPGVLFFGNRNGDKPARGLSGIQVQPPNGYTWDYRPGKNNNGGALFMKLPHAKLDVKQWSQCEVLVKTTGELRVACCQLAGNTPCKGVEQLRFKDAAAANKKSPFGIQMHNGGLFDEYKDIWIETDPAVDDLLSIK